MTAMCPANRTARMAMHSWQPAMLVVVLLGGCATRAPVDTAPRPADVRAAIVARMPSSVSDREGWAADIAVAFSAQGIAPDTSNICAVLAVVAQESTFQADPPVPGLPGIARAEIDRRAAARHIPAFLVSAALRLESPDGRSYAARLGTVRTEQQLSALFEDFIATVPMGGRLFGGLNPVHTAGPMQVSISFAEQNAKGYPYPVATTIRHEVFSRRGGLYFGIAHLFGYPAPYDQMLYRFADFNAGWYASRNAAFQAAVSAASGIALELDGDVLRPGASLDSAGATEKAVRVLQGPLDMDVRGIRRALEKGGEADFAATGLYRRVFELADAAEGTPVPRAVLPGIALDSPKITRSLTTAWFAQRVETRWGQCMSRGS